MGGRAVRWQLRAAQISHQALIHITLPYNHLCQNADLNDDYDAQGNVKCFDELEALWAHKDAGIFAFCLPCHHHLELLRGLFESRIVNILRGILLNF